MSEARARPALRVLLAVLLCTGSAVIAFIAGTAFGGRYLVPPGQGLAAPAEAMGYGLLAALAVTVAMAVVSAVLSLRRLAWATGVAVLIAAGLCGLLVFIALSAEAGGAS